MSYVIKFFLKQFCKGMRGNKKQKSMRINLDSDQERYQRRNIQFKDNNKKIPKSTKPVFICFIDYEKAFDHVYHDIIMQRLAHINMN